MDLDTDNVRLARELSRALLWNAPIAMRILARDLRIVFINASFRELFKVRREEAIGRHCHDFVNRGRPCRHCPARDVFSTRCQQTVRMKDILADGTVVHYDAHVFPLVNEDGACEHVLEVMIDRSKEMAFRENNALIFVSVVAMFASLLDMKDPYTATHSRAVTEISVKLGRYIGLTEGECFDLRLSSLLHDLGKIIIPDDIIGKPSPLTASERKIMERHPAETMRMLDNLSKFGAIRDMAGHHHERWDGYGYPDRLREDEIPLGARIIALADAYDAMTSNRSYRAAMSHDQALEEIRQNAGTQFDPLLTEMFLRMAERRFTSCDMMKLPDPHPARSNTTRSRVFRKHLPAAPGPRTPPGRSVTAIISDDSISLDILRKSPLDYCVLDGDFTIVFASDSSCRRLGLDPRSLLNKRCYEVPEKRGACGAARDGDIRCPVAGALLTGETRSVRTVEHLFGQSNHYRVFAVPLDIEDRDGKMVRRVVEIRLDRSGEMEERTAMIGDARSLLDMLYGLVAEIDSATTRGSTQILLECESFEEYLTEITHKFRALTEKDTGVQEGG